MALCRNNHVKELQNFKLYKRNGKEQVYEPFYKTVQGFTVSTNSEQKRLPDYLNLIPVQLGLFGAVHDHSKKVC